MKEKNLSKMISAHHDPERRCRRRARRMPMTALRKAWISKCSCLEKACASSKAKRRSRAATSTADWRPIASVITTRAMA